MSWINSTSSLAFKPLNTLSSKPLSKLNKAQLGVQRGKSADWKFVLVMALRLNGFKTESRLNNPRLSRSMLSSSLIGNWGIFAKTDDFLTRKSFSYTNIQPAQMPNIWSSQGIKAIINKELCISSILIIDFGMISKFPLSKELFSWLHWSFSLSWTAQQSFYGLQTSFSLHRKNLISWNISLNLEMIYVFDILYSCGNSDNQWDGGWQK